MATTEHIKALIQSHAEGDDSRFYSVAVQAAAHAARQGHGKQASELREVIDQARDKTTKTGAKLVPLAQPRGELSGLLTASYPKGHLPDMALDEEIRGRLDRVLAEQRERSRLQEYGLTPIRKILLVGPPGTGKTMTASVLGGELGLPLFTVRLDGLITKFLGETAAKLRLIFDAVGQTRGIYLFDEFDALGGERGAGNDVGEIRRVVNSFLQFFEADQSDSLIVAATNHVQLLDRALFRRFDSVIEYRLPSRSVSLDVLRARLALMDITGIDWNKVIKCTEGLSHAEISKACETAAKNVILQRRTRVSSEDLCAALLDRRSVLTIDWLAQDGSSSRS
jgi:SpoVK/Ycf46/Vps4 family AAA+-type ATPase